MPPAASSLFTRLADVTDELLGLLSRMEAELPEKPSKPVTQIGGTAASHDPAWHAQVAMWVLEVHAGLRELETNLKYQLAGTIRTRGGSDRNTEIALERLPQLAAGLDYSAAMSTVRRLERWSYRGRVLLGDVEPYGKLPRLPGLPDPVCPYCNAASLRFIAVSGVVRCVRPGCTDGNGRAPAARIEFGDFSHEPMLAWDDGITGLNYGDMTTVMTG